MWQSSTQTGLYVQHTGQPSQWKFKERGKLSWASSFFPQQNSEINHITSLSRQLPHCIPWTAFLWKDGNNGTKWQRILGYKQHPGIKPQGFIEVECHRSDWLWRKLTEIISSITQAEAEVFVKMSRLWIVPIYLLSNAWVFFKSLYLMRHWTVSSLPHQSLLLGNTICQFSFRGRL